jgi:hypothetical protein
MLTLCTLAGAVVTWGVAWGCAIWGVTPPIEDGVEVQPVQWLAVPGPEWPSPDVATICETQIRTFVIMAGFAEGRRYVQVRIDHGWPLRSMRAVLVGHSGQDIGAARIEAPPWLRPSKSNFGLPPRVIPVGFTLNTLLAAGVLLGLVEGFAFARRRVRRRKGRCAACGYDRGGLAGDAAACPECGAAAS